MNVNLSAGLLSIGSEGLCEDGTVRQGQILEVNKKKAHLEAFFQIF